MKDGDDMALYAGWDVFTPDAGTRESMTCPVCNQEMEVKRNITGPTGWAEAMSGHGHLHDKFTCPHAEEKWHVQVRNLRQAIEETPSAKLADIYNQEINEILACKEPTKDVSVY